MSGREEPGMATVREWLGRHPDRALRDACYRMAVEIRSEINGLWAAMNGQVSARPGKREVARREARIDGMKWMLAHALGFPLSGWQDEVELFLEEFRAERLDASRRAREAST